MIVYATFGGPKSGASENGPDNGTEATRLSNQTNTGISLSSPSIEKVRYSAGPGRFLQGLQVAGPNAYSTLSKAQPRPENHPNEYPFSWVPGTAFREYCAFQGLFGVIREEFQSAYC